MVDWATVALSATGGLSGVLLTVLLERRREDGRDRDALRRRQDMLDERLRHAELGLANLHPAETFFREMMERGYRRGGRR